ncbi:MAG TPA: helix-turn-helix domain-containing protein [Candidatus Limnocylindria bacterium]|nr:helix-turn-helix domain-containing protein [Candidatus Limnocylindria bacterium]
MIKNENPLVDALVKSKLYQDYERAFSETTGLPITLRSADSLPLAHHGRRKENRFCAMLAGNSRACANCLQVQQELTDVSALEPHTVQCRVGLNDTAVPVRLGERLIGYLQTGQVFRKEPTEDQFQKTLALVREWGVSVSEQELHSAFFQSRVMGAQEHHAMVKMLSIFAQHISMMTNQILVQQENAEPPMIVRAKQYIHEHQGEDITLGQVAKAVNISSFYFCKMFRKVTGVNFTDYVSRVRIEKARNLLLNPQLRVSEIAFEVGFQSLTHFNRVFKKITGESPTQYRSRIRSSQ